MSRNLKFEDSIDGAGPGIIELMPEPVLFCHCNKDIADEILSFYKPAKTLKDTFNERKKQFGLSLKPFVDEYSFQLIEDFYRFWCEPNKSRTKFRQEMQKTWDTKLRLETWKRNSKGKYDARPVQQNVIGRQTIENVQNNAQNWR